MKEQRNGDFNLLRLDTSDTSYMMLRDILVTAGETGYNSLADRVIDLYDSGAVNARSLLMGLCRQLANVNLEFAQEKGVGELRTRVEAIQHENDLAWREVNVVRAELEV